MFGIGMPELVIIFVIALLVFGPKELPKIGKTIGKAMGEFRRASDELKEGIQREIDLAEREQTDESSTAPVASSTAETVPAEPPVAGGSAPEPQLELPMSEASASASVSGTSSEIPPASDAGTGAGGAVAAASDPIPPASPEPDPARIPAPPPSAAGATPPSGKPSETTHV